jgi:hypothetical protein
MDYLTSKTPIQFLQTGAQRAIDRRLTKRRPLRSRALIGIPGKAAIRGNVVDISAGGLSVILPIAPDIGIECTMFFTIMLDGKIITVSGYGKVLNCVCGSSEGFRIGMKFHTQDPQAQSALQKLLGDEPMVPGA